MNRVRHSCLLLIVAVFALATAAPPVAQSSSLKALVGGRLVDGFGGAPIPNSVILIEGERIKAVGQVGG